MLVQLLCVQNTWAYIREVLRTSLLLVISSDRLIKQKEFIKVVVKYKQLTRINILKDKTY